MKDAEILKTLNKKLAGELKREFVSLLSEYRRRLAIEDTEKELVERIQDLSDLVREEERKGGPVRRGR